MSQDSETGTEDGSAPEMSTADVLNMLAAEFDQFCQERHNDGAKEYGPTRFASNNMFQMIAEEMADIANYCRYQYIKLRLMEGTFISDESRTDFTSSGVQSSEHEVPSGPSAFAGAGGLSELLQATRRSSHPGQWGGGGLPGANGHTG